MGKGAINDPKGREVIGNIGEKPEDILDIFNG